MKKLLLVFMACILVLTLAACGGGADETTTAAPDVTTTAAATTTEAPATTTAAPATTTAAPVTTTEEVTTTEAPATTEAAQDVSAFATALSIKAPAARTPAASYTVWDGSIASGFAGGSGTESDPYLISNGAELAYLAYLVNTSPIIVSEDAAQTAENPTTGMYYKLTNDIYLNDVSASSEWSLENQPANLWTPIGLCKFDVEDGVSRQFTGTLDGAGFAIFGMYVPSTYYYGGLFSRINGDVVMNGGEGSAAVTTLDELIVTGKDGVGAEICNLTISHAFVSGYRMAGAISGYSERANYTNIVVDNTVTIELYTKDNTNSGAVGGIIGRAQFGVMEDCINSAEVRTNGQLIVAEDGSQKWSYGQMSGGIAGCLVGLVNRCANFGDVYVTTCGGLICGYAGGSNIGAYITDCYVEGTVYSAWEKIFDASVADVRSVTDAGIFCGRWVHVTSTLEYAVERCVSAGEYAIDPAMVTWKGYLCGRHGEYTMVRDVMFVTREFPEEFGYTGDWETKGVFLVENIVEVSPEQFQEYRAQYAQ